MSQCKLLVKVYSIEVKYLLKLLISSDDTFLKLMSIGNISKEDASNGNS